MLFVVLVYADVDADVDADADADVGVALDEFVEDDIWAGAVVHRLLQKKEK